MIRSLAAFSVVLVVAAGCGRTETELPANPPPAAKAAVTPQAPASVDAPQPAPVAEAPPSLPVGEKATLKEMGGAVIERVEKEEVRGTALEVLPAGGFTYVRARVKNAEEWIVLDSSAPVAVGDKLTVRAKMVAEKFHSQSLNRTFDRVTFADRIGAPASAVADAKGAAMPPAMLPGGMQMPAGHPPMGTGASRVADDTPVKVEKATGDNAKTVAEIWAGRADLRGETILVRGKVVKSLADVMGRNWIHLRDGSGSAEAGDHDITVTTAEAIKAGEIVTVKGKVGIDRDFGAGYRYAVIIEDATVSAN